MVSKPQDFKADFVIDVKAEGLKWGTVLEGKIAAKQYVIGEQYSPTTKVQIGSVTVFVTADEFTAAGLVYRGQVTELIKSTYRKAGWTTVYLGPEEDGYKLMLSYTIPPERATAPG